MSESLRVAIDGRTLQGRPPGGVGRSLLSLLPGIAGTAEVDLLLDPRRPAPGPLPPVRTHFLRSRLSARDAVWLQLVAARWLRGYPGIFHCPFYGLPYVQATPMVVTIHDLTFEFAPHWFSAAHRIAFRRQARWAARTAAKIIVPTRHVAATVLDRYERYGASPERIAVVGWPVDPRFQPAPEGFEARLERLGLGRDHVVALGGAGRRRLPTAIGAWRAALRRLDSSPQETPLVVVGTERPPPAAGLIYLGPLPDPDWAAVLAGARAFVYPTLYEGYGMPAIEALASGTALVCSRVGSLPEVVGEAAAWAEDNGEEALGAALTEVLADPAVAARASAAGLTRAAALPAPEQAAGTTLDAYRAAAQSAQARASNR